MSDSKEEQSTMQAVVTGTWRTMARIGSVLGRKSAGDASVKVQAFHINPTMRTFNRASSGATETPHNPNPQNHSQEVPIPVPTAEQLLVEVTTVALNPTDFKHIDVVSPNNAVIGCDYSGVVKAVGSGVKNWAVGDRAAGVVHGAVTLTKCACICLTQGSVCMCFWISVYATFLPQGVFTTIRAPSPNIWWLMQRWSGIFSKVSCPRALDMCAVI